MFQFCRRDRRHRRGKETGGFWTKRAESRHFLVLGRFQNSSGRLLHYTQISVQIASHSEFSVVDHEPERRTLCASEDEFGPAEEYRLAPVL